jgi:hypothetical protein
MIAGAEGIRERSPGQAVGADDVLDDIVVGEREVEEVEFVAVREDLDVPDFRQAKTARCVHVRSLP